MRLTHVITRLIIGGAQENTIASVLGLSQKPGLKVTLISGPTTGPEGSLESLVNSSRDMLRVVPQLVRPVRPWTDWRALQALTRIFRAEAPDLVHTHSGKAGVLGRLAAARSGVPLIVHTIHGPSFGLFQGPLSNSAFRLAERRAARVTTHFVVVAEAMTRQYLAAGIGRPDQFTRIFSGFPLQPFLTATNDPQVRARLGLTTEDLVVGNIARLCPLKGHDELFAVAPALVKRWPRLKFLLVGDGESRPRLENQARELGLQKHFVFTGMVAPNEVPALVGIMDVLVHLSFREGLARALPQALAAGKPVVAYDCDGAGEVCQDNETGFLVSCRDQGLLTQRLLLLAGDAGLRARFGENGRQFVRQRFDVQNMVDELHRLYLRLTEESRKHTATPAVPEPQFQKE
ncbi:MAG TPA: glycosyltransferase [Verrucomicrobiae bacterium]|nr:glycosyltransferase [Verrucomicrobiae bacterium]